MAEKISDLTGEAREQRIAELKQKMMASAAKAKAAYAAGIMPAQAFGLSGGSAPAAAPVAVAEVARLLLLQLPSRPPRAICARRQRRRAQAKACNCTRSGGQDAAQAQG